MSTGLIAILDDVVLIAKLAAQALDDASVQAAKAGSKAAGIVIDDAAVTPRYVVGLASNRELPIIAKIAKGSLKNKLLFLLPASMGLSLVAPFLITPLLMCGGAYLCLEGFHKVLDLVGLGHHDDHAEPEASVGGDALAIEDSRVAGAVRTDFILSAEIMAITLSSVSHSPLWMQAVTLGVVGVGMTLLVYGAVAIIVKADDVGMAMAQSSNGAARALGRGIVAGMPWFLQGLSLLGMAAMLWVGGGILVHGLYELGWSRPEDEIHHLAELAAKAVPAAPAVVDWLVNASVAGLLGLVTGGLVDLVVQWAMKPLWGAIQKARNKG